MVEEARHLRMIGLYGLPVTNHVFSQKMYEHTDGHPVGVCLGDTPMSFHNVDEPLKAGHLAPTRDRAMAAAV